MALVAYMSTPPHPIWDSTEAGAALSTSSSCDCTSMTRWICIAEASVKTSTSRRNARVARNSSTMAVKFGSSDASCGVASRHHHHNTTKYRFVITHGLAHVACRGQPATTWPSRKWKGGRRADDLISRRVLGSTRKCYASPSRPSPTAPPLTQRYASQLSARSSSSLGAALAAAISTQHSHHKTELFLRNGDNVPGLHGQQRRVAKKGGGRHSYIPHSSPRPSRPTSPSSCRVRRPTRSLRSVAP